MEQQKGIGNVIQFIKKYKYVCLVLVSGVILMFLPEKPIYTEDKTPEIQSVTEMPDLQEQLEEILGNMDGAGRVKVLLTQALGTQTIYQYDENYSKQDSSENKRCETVIISDAQREQGGLIQQIIPPKYLGAIILCQGAESAAVRLNITKAVSNVTGLSFDKIAVMKIK